jgi:hypothetical protein
MATVGDGERSSDEHVARHVNPAESESSPTREFGTFLNENLREVLLIVCGAGGAIAGGFIQAFQFHRSASSRLLGLLIGLVGLLIVTSYALRFYPHPIESQWWSRGRIRRAARQVILKAWAVAIGAFFLSGAGVWFWQLTR